MAYQSRDFHRLLSPIALLDSVEGGITDFVVTQQLLHVAYQQCLLPGEPLDKDIYDLEPEDLADVPTTPATLEAALEALRADHDFLLRGDVFTPDVIDTWTWYKQTHEVDALRARPHPYEFTLYYDV